jgi:SET domain-containing protein
MFAGRFVNHSCEPNCEMQKWSVNGLFRMALFALREIHPHEELSYDYNFSLFNPAEGQVLFHIPSFKSSKIVIICLEYIEVSYGIFVG